MKVNPVTMMLPMGNRVGQIAPQNASPQMFTEILFNAVQDVNKMQLEADEATKKLVLGEISDVHEVMLSTEKAKLALQLTLQIRNKLVESYQEISRMQF